MLAPKYYFSYIIFLSCVSELLAAMCWGQAARQAERRPAWPRAGMGGLEQASAEVLRAAVGMIQRDVCQLLSQC